jgi:hypothetical protein
MLDLSSEVPATPKTIRKSTRSKSVRPPVPPSISSAPAAPQETKKKRPENSWIRHVKEVAAQRQMKFSSALRDSSVKEGYKSKKT